MKSIKNNQINLFPKNHHYVSRCHLKEFFNTENKRIYLYDKKLDNYDSKQGISKIFSLDNLNNRKSNQRIDRISMELELRVMFEENFSIHLSWVKKFYEDTSLIKQAYEHLNFIAIMALVGEYRNPNYKKGLDDALENIKSQIQMEGLKILDEINHPDLVFQNIKGYIEVASLFLKEMDPITFSIVVINSNDHFLLPDTTSFIVREHFEHGKLIQFGIPISDKIFVLGKSVKLGKRPTQIIQIDKDNDELVFKINSDLVNYAYQTVACKDNDFLKETIRKMITLKFKGQYFHGYTF